jgi:hypothetical protein
LQRNNDAFVGRYVDTGDAGHGHSLLLPAQSRPPGDRSTRGASKR